MAEKWYRFFASRFYNAQAEMAFRTQDCDQITTNLRLTRVKGECVMMTIYLVQASWGKDAERGGYSFFASVLPQIYENRQEAEAAAKASKYRDAKVVEVDLREKKVHAAPMDARWVDY